MYEELFTSMNIGSLTIKNRFVMPAMNSNLHDETHQFSDQGIRYYAARAEGGYGLLITEFLCVSEEGLAGSTQAAIYDDCFIPQLSKIAEAVHEKGGRIFAQLQHSGRVAKGNNGLPLVSSFYFPSRPDGTKVHMLTIEEIKEVEDKFVKAALRAKKAGFDGVEIHGAHGYLLDQFLAKDVNKRTDIYGGSITNRARIVCEIVTAVKEACGKDYPVSVRISGQSTAPGGNTIEEAAAQALLFEEAGCDVINVSYGNAIETYYQNSGFNLSNVRKVKDLVSVPVIGVGRINDPTLALSAIKGGYMDFVATGRQSIADSQFPNKIREGRIKEIISCTGCLQRCLDKSTFEEGYGVSCMNNPFSGKEGDWVIKKTDSPKKIAVIGAGPAGLQAAWILAARNHKVTLFEKNSTLGGQFALAAVPPMKGDLAKTITTYGVFAEKFGVEFRMNTCADRKMLEEEGYEIIVDATGSIPVVPRIQGIDGENVFTAQQVLTFEKQCQNQKVLVLGAGLVGAETAELLSQQGNAVTLVDMISEIAPLAPSGIRRALKARLEKNNVVFKGGCRVATIETDGISYLQGEEEGRLSGFDTIILAFGSRANTRLQQEYEDVENFHSIGDSSKAGDARKAIFEATRLALDL